ncbi:beta-ketoacyl synthase N-terminal-like domain-containing protein [Actinomadura sp. CNU-125]|uniref:beta-ketoacyl synthase N-terminal-like domain-containing protein n=1 Tax=Actinomadura sp. CNU-125 TaxID=1904961 RepID=UPI0009FB3BE8|nr:beta-ketoacyl synthase N-terminal-like domain-containing protein [Actinomadura sp. CNU-125]
MNAPVVVTGMAWTTPLGDGLDDVWRLLCAGAVGVVPVGAPYPLRTPLAAPVPDPPYGSAAPGERQVALAARTLAAAFADAGLATDDPAVGLVLGTSFGGQLDTEEEPGRHWTREVADRIGHPGVPVCVTTACSAGADALLVADALIRGGVPICVAGGADVLSEAKRLGHSALGTMSPTGLRAFDAGHDGMVLGEGAGFLVLEPEETARARGARVYARLDGAGSANDAAGLTAPDPTGDGVLAAVRRCPGDARDVAVVCAHGTGTPVNDEVESTALHRLFAGTGSDPVVFGTKGNFGHSLGATGAIEAIATVLALRHGTPPPLTGLASPMPGFTLRTADGETPVGRGEAGLSLTLGFGGFNTCLRFSRAGPSPDSHGSSHAGSCADSRGSSRADDCGGCCELPASDSCTGSHAGLRAEPGAGSCGGSLDEASVRAGEDGRGPGAEPTGTGTAAVVGHGAVTVDDPAACSADRPSFYADPAAWLVAAAVAAASTTAECGTDVLAARDDAGVIVLTGPQPPPTCTALAAQAARGRISPLRFAGANPGILAGLACIRWGLRGPSLVLAAADDGTVGTALTVAGSWLRSRRARHVICVRHLARPGRHTALCAVLRAAAEPGADPRALLTAPLTTPA